jgi:hypothetical protein
VLAKPHMDDNPQGIAVDHLKTAGANGASRVSAGGSTIRRKPSAMKWTVRRILALLVNYFLTAAHCRCNCDQARAALLSRSAATVGAACLPISAATT